MVVVLSATYASAKTRKGIRKLAHFASLGLLQTTLTQPCAKHGFSSSYQTF